MSTSRAITILAATLALFPMCAAQAAGGRLAAASVSGANAATAAHMASRPARPGGGVESDRDRRFVGAAYGYYWYEDSAWTEDAVAEEPPAPPPEPAAPPPPPPAVGTTLMALPTGCGTVERNGKFLRQCGGVFYEERFEGDRVVYTVVQ